MTIHQEAPFNLMIGSTFLGDIFLHSFELLALKDIE